MDRGDPAPEASAGLGLLKPSPHAPEKLEALAESFASAVPPELRISMAAVQAHLMTHRADPVQAVATSADVFAAPGPVDELAGAAGAAGAGIGSGLVSSNGAAAPAGAADGAGYLCEN